MNSISNGNSMLMLQANMQALLMADSALNRAQIQGSAANALDGRANVLESEIKTGNGNLEAMKQKMEGLREAAQDARSSQAGTLGSAIEVLNENSTADKTKAPNPSAAANVPAYEEHTADQTEETEGNKKKEGRYDEVTVTASKTEWEDTSAPVVSGDGRESLSGAESSGLAAGNGRGTESPRREILSLAASFAVNEEDMAVKGLRLAEKTGSLHGKETKSKELPELSGDRIYTSGGSILPLPEKSTIYGQEIKMNDAGKWLPETMDFSRRFDIVEMETAVHGRKTLFMGKDSEYDQRMADYYGQSYKYFMGIAEKCIKDKDSSLLEKEYEKMKAELDGEDDYQAAILRLCYKSGIDGYGTLMKWQAYEKEHHWIEMGKEKEYNQQAEELKNDLLADGFSVPPKKGHAGTVSYSVYDFIRYVHQSLCRSAGFQTNTSQDGRIMSNGEIQDYFERYEGIL